MNELDNTEAIIKRHGPFVDSLSLPELRIVNRMVVERIRLIQKAGTLYSMSQFHAGDRVSWKGSDGSTQTGIIMRLNQKSISVNTGDGGYWNVSPELLNKV